jgi:hypothetical protein
MDIRAISARSSVSDRARPDAGIYIKLMRQAGQFQRARPCALTIRCINLFTSRQSAKQCFSLFVLELRIDPSALEISR